MVIFAVLFAATTKLPAPEIVAALIVMSPTVVLLVVMLVAAFRATAPPFMVTGPFIVRPAVRVIFPVLPVLPSVNELPEVLEVTALLMVTLNVVVLPITDTFPAVK
jgi:hypothetical protein